MSTHPRVFARPLRAEQAIGRVETWLAHPNVRVIREPDEHWRLLEQILENVGTMGNLCIDAHLASLAVAHGATLVSCDAEFGRFAMLRLESPLASKRSRGSGRG